VVVVGGVALALLVVAAAVRMAHGGARKAAPGGPARAPRHLGRPQGTVDVVPGRAGVAKHQAGLRAIMQRLPHRRTR
jgi:hypothetical protein